MVDGLDGCIATGGADGCAVVKSLDFIAVLWFEE